MTKNIEWVWLNLSSVMVQYMKHKERKWQKSWVKATKSSGELLQSFKSTFFHRSVRSRICVWVASGGVTDEKNFGYEAVVQKLTHSCWKNTGLKESCSMCASCCRQPL